MIIKKEKIKVYDMTCSSCENRIERAVKKLPGVSNAIASYSTQQVIVEYDTDYCDTSKIKESIKAAGYGIENSSGSYKIVGIFIVAAAIILLGSSTGGFDMSAKLNGASYFVLFIVGMLTSIHCVGMCGGIMLSQSISKENTSKFQAIKPAILYNAGRVLSYTVIGGIVGALGSVLALSLTAKAAMQIFAGIFMIIMGLNMAGFGLFRRFNIKLPWSACSIKKRPQTPFLIGILNGLLPCGPLQTMQLYALGTGSAAKGAISMFLFALGTVPLMLTFGAASGLLSKGYTKKILKMSGFLVIILGLIMGNRGLALAGVGVPNITTVAKSLTSSSSGKSNIRKAVLKNGYQEITMTADGSGYTPNAFYVKKNVPVKWIIKGDAINSCNNAIVIPSLNKQQTLKSGKNVIEFTPGNKDINFSCWMGMIRGVIKVTDNLDKVDTSKADSSIPAPSSGMSCCTGGPGTGTGSTQQAKSIYGNDISKVSTSRLVKKAIISGNNQKINFKGIGYEFEPLIVVADKDKAAKLSVDLKKFDTPDQKFEIVNNDTGDTIASFQGKKGTISLNLKFNRKGTYLIVSGSNVLSVISVVDDVSKVDIEKVRKQLIS